MKTILKFKLDVCDKQTIQIPKDYIFLDIKKQLGDIVLFAYVDTDQELTDVSIKCYGEYYNMPDELDGPYLGCAVCGDYVWFYFLDV